MAANDKKPDNRDEHTRPDRVSLRPLSFEEALTGLLQVAPPPKDDAPEAEPESPPAKQPRKHKTRQDKESGSR